MALRRKFHAIVALFRDYGSEDVGGRACSGKSRASAFPLTGDAADFNFGADSLLEDFSQQG
jgi:hypothetical protein